MAKRPEDGRNKHTQFQPRSRSYRERQVGNRLETQRILIVCGGETEKWYFNRFKAIVRLLTLEVHAKGVDPQTLVRWADKMKTKEEINGDLDAVWCVFDCDDFGPRYAQAHSDAESAGFLLAASNPCFELWFILHFREVKTEIATPQCAQMLEKLLKKPYSKTEAALFETLEPKRAQAMTRAAQLQKQHSGSGVTATLLNPSTSVHQLLETLERNGLR